MPIDAKAVLETIKKAREKSEKRKFTQSIELIVNLQDIDMKKDEAKIQESIELPHPPGKTLKACVIASGELALRAKRTGAELVMSKPDLESLATDKKRQKKLANEYDVFLAEAPLMPLVGRAMGSILGPRGKMPKPLPPNINIKAQLEKSRKTINIRMRGQPVLHCAVGSEDMRDEEIAENVIVVVGRLEGRLKRGLRNISTILLKTTMGPPVRIKL